MNETSIGALIAQALRGEEDDTTAWEAVRALQGLGSDEVFEAARLMLQSAEAKQRARGADILGQLGTPDPSRELEVKCADCLLERAGTEANETVLLSIGVSLGHLQDPRAPEAMARHAGNASPDARFGVVMALLNHDGELSIATLVTLARDGDDDVRNWATFGLGTSLAMVDTPEVREVLRERLADANAEIQGEAVTGLASRRDPSALEPIRRELSGEAPRAFAVEAAGLLGDASLLPLLKALKATSQPGYVDSMLDDAIAALEQG